MRREVIIMPECFKETCRECIRVAEIVMWKHATSFYWILEEYVEFFVRDRYIKIIP